MKTSTKRRGVTLAIAAGAAVCVATVAVAALDAGLSLGALVVARSILVLVQGVAFVGLLHQADRRLRAARVQSHQLYLGLR